MKLVRFGKPGTERPGVIDSGGNIRDLSAIVPDFAGAWLDADHLGLLRLIDIDGLPSIEPGTRLGPPVAGTRNFIGIGLNYFDHARETSQERPSEPVVFLKSVGSLSGPADDIVLPRGSVKTDWEIEVAVVIGRTARNVSRSDAPGHIAGYTICNDVSEREWQGERGGTWDKGKSFDTFGPLGPWLVTPDEVTDPQALAMFLEVDGQRMQTGTTADMIFPFDELVSYCSTIMTLFPGDVITTGTPAGIGLARRPPVFLSSGTVVHLEVEGLGTQTQRVREPKPAAASASVTTDVQER